jgi:hypothetical protein
MTYHKIRGVDKTTCTAEQKIAYNMAWYIWNDCRYNWTACRTRIDWSEQENAAIRDYMDNWQRNYAEKKQKVRYRQYLLCPACRSARLLDRIRTHLDKL